MICKHCGTIRIDPYISPNDGVEYYTRVYPKAYFLQGQSLEERYERAKEYSNAHLFSPVINGKRNELGRSLHILDYGGGTGGKLENFKEDHHIYVYDINDERMHFAETKGYHVVNPNREYDVLYSCHTMEHWIALKETTTHFLSFVNKDHGVVIIELPFVDRIINGARKRGIIEELYFPHKWCFFVNSLRIFMGSYGFVCTDSDYEKYAIFEFNELKAKRECLVLKQSIYHENLRKIRLARWNGFLSSLKTLVRRILMKDL